MTQPHRSVRRGASLIELVLIIGIVTVLLGICGAFFHLLLGLERSGRVALGDARSVARLARQFREDVRGSRVVKSVPTGLDLSRLDGSSVAYRTEPNALVRTESADGKRLRREGYTLTMFGTPSFETEANLVRLSIPRKPSPGNEGVRPGIRIEATPRKDLTLSTAAEAPK